MLEVWRMAFLMVGVCFVAAVRGDEAAPARVAEPSEALRDELQLSPAYHKCVMLRSFPIVGSDKVSDFAMLEAAFLVEAMLAERPELLDALARNKVRLAVMATGELTTDVPEHSDLKPATYWNKRARGLGPTPQRPAVSCAEENLLCHEGDPYKGENILIHEFAHAVHLMGVNSVDPTFDARLAAVYKNAMTAGRWKGTYGATNKEEYFAEGVQSWFECNRCGTHEHNDVGTRAEVKAYDPELARLIGEVFGDRPWVYATPQSRPAPAHLAGLDRTKAPRFAWPKELLEAQKRERPKDDSK